MGDYGTVCGEKAVGYYKWTPASKPIYVCSMHLRVVRSHCYRKGELGVQIERCQTTRTCEMMIYEDENQTIR